MHIKRLICAITFLANMASSSSVALSAAAASDRISNPVPTKTAQALHQLFDDDWRWTMTSFPESATATGYPGQNARWTDMSLAAITERQRHPVQTLERLLAIPRSSLSAKDQLNYDLFKRQCENEIEIGRFNEHLLAITQLDGVHLDPANLLAMMPTSSAQDYRDIIARLETLPVLIDQHLVLLSEGLKQGITHSATSLRDVPEQIRAQIVEDPMASPLMAAFKHFPESISREEQDKLKKAATLALLEKVVPAYKRLLSFVEKQYLPKARTSFGLSDLPDGKLWYAQRVKQSTTTSLSPDEIHAIGLSEVKRIRAEMDKVIAELKFKGSFAEFLHFLRTDPQFFMKDKESLLTAYRDIAKRADPQLPKLFGHLPRLPYGVSPVPDYAEKSQPTAYYLPGSLEAGRPGVFYANTYALETRPSWEMEALTLHEAVPGHHLQIAIAQELEDLPDFRREGGHTAFIEGWGLYAESLGGELGFYTNPYARFGSLSYEMWRAIRLVLDTGLHAKGWTRQQAIDYFYANSSKTPHDISVEVDRYIVWPGQALGYKMGELKFKELRAKASKRLGDKFDVRQFHDKVLELGSVPLEVLEKHVNSWLDEKVKASS